jgi:membrane-associated phospholipid phosphatase
MALMHYLRENKKLVFIALSLPLFFFYLDTIIVSFLKIYYVKKSAVYTVLEHATPFMNFISHGSTQIAFAVLLYLAGRFLNQKYSSAGKSLLIGIISSGIVVQILKHFIGRVRPRLTENLVFAGPSFKNGYDSFPSGHATVAFCMAYVLASHFPRYKAVFYCVAIMIGLERVEGLAHFPSDVLAGGLIGIVIAKLLSVKLFPLDSPSLSKSSGESPGNLMQEDRH